MFKLMRSPKMLLMGGMVATALAASLAGSASAGSPSPGKTHVQAIALAIVGTANGGEVVSPLGNFAVAPGVPMRITITNFTREYHTFTIPGLHLSRLILPAHGDTPKETTFTITASEGGRFAWYCAICQGGGHGQRHHMGGTISAIIDPSVLP